MPEIIDVGALERRLAPLSHGTEALTVLRTALQQVDRYVPPLPDDDADVLFNVALLDPFAQCSNAALAAAERRASMTLLGWRVFGALLRNIQVREAVEEVAIRTA